MNYDLWRHKYTIQGNSGVPICPDSSRFVSIWRDLARLQTKKEPQQSSDYWGSVVYVAATYSPTLWCSTIGDDRFNDSVRNGKRWDPIAITALISLTILWKEAGHFIIFDVWCMISCSVIKGFWFLFASLLYFAFGIRFFENLLSLSLRLFDLSTHRERFSGRSLSGN